MLNVAQTMKVSVLIKLICDCEECNNGFMPAQRLAITLHYFFLTFYTFFKEPSTEKLYKKWVYEVLF